MARLAWLGLVGLVACGFSPGVNRATDGGALDSGGEDALDSGIDAASGEGGVDPSLCYGAGSGLFTMCLTAQPTDELVLHDKDKLDTGKVADCAVPVPQTDGTSVCVHAVKSLSVDLAATVRITGNKPLVFLVQGAVEIDGTLDLSSHKATAVPGSSGAGFDYDGCLIPIAAMGNPGGGGGGAGGGFGDPGGAGGAGNAGSTSVGLGGIAHVEPAPTVVRAGCPGASGGTGTGGAAGGIGGTSGGAIYIIAFGGITIGPNGRILANGAGGGGGGIDAGGAGGGGGGLIGLVSPLITITGNLAANGGGGGQGGDNNPPSGNLGHAGADASDSPAQAPGGDGAPTIAGIGGAGGGGTIDPTAGSDQAAGGGGGGGGYGVTFIVGTLAGIERISPPPTGFFTVAPSR